MLGGCLGFGGKWREYGVSAVLALLIGVAVDPGPAFGALAPTPQIDVRRDHSQPDRRRDQDGVLDIESDSLPQSSVVTIRRRIIIRIPMVPMALPLAPEPGGSATRAMVPPRMEPGPPCVAHRKIQRASLSERNGVVLLMAGNTRYQARLERGCRPADFQSGFYINPTADGAVCAGRDLLHARSGANCLITRFSRIRSAK